MGLFSFLQWFRAKPSVLPEKGQETYLPHMEEDFHCQIGLVPAANKVFVEQQFRQIDDTIGDTETAYGFRDIYIRGPHPVTTASIEIRIDALMPHFQRWQFQEAAHIRYWPGNKFLNCIPGKTKAFGLAGFTIFFDHDGELVRNVWMQLVSIDRQKQLLLLEALYDVGETYELLLVDWNNRTTVDLRDRNQIKHYLAKFSC